MDLIKYSPDVINLNLSAYKYCIFSLIISIHNKKRIPNKNDKLFYTEILYYFINRTRDIYSKTELINEIKYQISSKLNKDINTNNAKKNEQKFSSQLISLLNENLTSIKTINDLFFYFKQDLSFMKELEIPENFNQTGEKEIDENKTVFYINDISIIDIYIKKCLLSFKLLSFPKLIKLYEDIIKFTNDKILLNQNQNISEKSKENYFSEIFNKNSSSFFKSDIFCDINDNNNDENTNTLESKENLTLSQKLFLIHKFYDYNLKYLYNDNSTNQTKLHYCLLYLTNLYYDCGFYGHALQILFECVKLSQSNCDHEALLKCFLWLSVIYIQQGDYNLASQCLKTCLIKSFQSNYQLLYLISSIELSNLNFIFGGNIGLRNKNLNEEEKNNLSNMVCDSLEEKIIAHSNDCEHLLNSIADYFSANISDNESNNMNNNGSNNNNGSDWLASINFNEAVKKNEDIKKIIAYTNMNQVINYILQGRYSLSIVYLKIIVKELFDDDNSFFNYKNKIYLNLNTNNNSLNEEKLPLKEFDTELIISLTNLINSIMEYDFDFFSEYLLKVCNLNKTLKSNYNFSFVTEKVNILSYIMLNKYLSQNQTYLYQDLLVTYSNNKIMKYLGIYFTFLQKYYSFVHKYYDTEELIDLVDYNYVNELLQFIEECKEYHFNTIYKKASILLVKVYINQNRLTEAVQIISPMIINNKNNNDLNKSNYSNNNYNSNDNDCEINYSNYNNNYTNDDNNNYLKNSENDNVIQYNIHDHMIGILYESYICEKNEMYSKVDDLLAKIHTDIEIYGSIEEKFDYFFLFTIHFRTCDYLKELLKYAIYLNNEKKIKQCLNLMKNFKFQGIDEIIKKIDKLLDEIHKFINYANMFNYDADGTVEIIYSINITNKKFIEDI